MSQSTTYSNRLVHETSPYLRQHAHNPVDWYPWSPEALQRARELDRPIFLSIGYSACHWCHVMEHESFEDAATALILNQHFVCIKVDREERPDLDQIYMTSVQLLTGHGGWPMSVFLTPDLQPFYGGTYFPPQDRYQLPGFKRVLQRIIELWQTERQNINRRAGELTEQIRSLDELHSSDVKPQTPLLSLAVSQLAARFDPIHGGFGTPPKFLHTMDMRLMLRAWKRTEDVEPLHLVRHTLEHMAMGGIYDHLGGGFARYSTDARWLVPHFEKMLYDNALLTTLFVETYQVTREPLFREVAEQTIGWVEREMTSPEGPFYSTLDADSEGVEGKFYVWRIAEIEQILGAEARLFCDVYNVVPDGNWEGHNILHRTRPLEDEGLKKRLAVMRAKLFDVRSKRVRPGRDDKLLTSWNGLMIGALAEASQALDVPRYAQLAARAADFILTKMRMPDGRLYRTCTIGHAPKYNGYLEDYAYLIDSLISLYEATFEPKWIAAALDLTLVMIDQFWDGQNAGFYFTGRDHEELLTRTKDVHDNATPSSNAMAVTALMRLVKFTGRVDLHEKAEATLRAFQGLMGNHPLAASQMILALDFHQGPVDEFAVVGDPAAEETQRVLRLLRQEYRPYKIVALQAPGASAVIPLLNGKTSDGVVSTYICRNFACQSPARGAAALADRLQPNVALAKLEDTQTS